MGGEGESVDVVVFGAQLKRGAVVQVKLVGMLRLKEGDGAIDDKLLAVAKGTPEYNVNSTDELNAKFNNSVAATVKFFRTYKGAGSGITSRGIGEAYEAMRLLYSSLWDYKVNN